MTKNSFVAVVIFKLISTNIFTRKMYVQNKHKGNKTKINKVNDIKTILDLNINQTSLEFTNLAV